MSGFEDLARRVASLEEQVQEEAGLRASQDRDLSSLAQGQRAANHLLQALSITQSEHTQMLDELHSDLTLIRADIAQIRTGHGAIVAMLQRLIDQGNGGGPTA